METVLVAFVNCHSFYKSYLGERGGLVVESLTPEREAGVRYLPPPCCVLEQRHIYSPKSTCNTQEEVVPSRDD